MSCVGGCWDQAQLEVYRCPQCRQTFTPRPVLNKNTILAELLEKLMATHVQSDAHALPYAAPGDVECDVCTGRKLKAVKFCLVCVACYCEAHLQPHYQSAAFKRHTLTKAAPKLHESICPQHNRQLEVFCHTDAKCICALCILDEHRGHDTVSAAAARAAKQKQFEEIRGRCGAREEG
ncbi:tripartite motif-containing protein 29-like [Sardina pilchardus]|uniref:tripartite motif-containing protein 29-like n=1 Tax=Sardina pilchardus TaxID=27697 RepID=UPI002E0D1A32